MSNNGFQPIKIQYIKKHVLNSQNQSVPVFAKVGIDTTVTLERVLKSAAKQGATSPEIIAGGNDFSKELFEKTVAKYWRSEEEAEPEQEQEDAKPKRKNSTRKKKAAAKPNEQSSIDDVETIE